MHSYASARAAMTTNLRHVHVRVRLLHQSQQRSRGTVAYNGGVAARQHGRQLAASGHQDSMTDQVDAPMEAMESPAPKPASDPAPSEPRQRELIGRDESELLTRDPRDRSVRAPPALQKVPNRPRPRDLRHISIAQMLMCTAGAAAPGFGTFFIGRKGH